MTTANVSWTYRGVNLSQVAYNVKATGAPEQVPGRRGENVVIPGAPGRTYVSKVFDERRLTLAMFVDAQPAAGGSRSGSQLWTNLSTLKNLFSQDGQGTLVHVNAAGGTLSAVAEVINVVEFEPEGPYHYNFAVEFVFADPYWYGATTSEGPDSVTSTSGTLSIVNPGTGQSDNASISVAGLIVDPSLAIGSNSVSYSGTVSAGSTLTLDVGNYTATLGTATVTGNVTHSGAARWLPIPAGTSSMVVTSSSVGTAAVSMSFATPYI